MKKGFIFIIKNNRIVYCRASNDLVGDLFANIQLHFPDGIFSPRELTKAVDELALSHKDMTVQALRFPD